MDPEDFSDHAHHETHVADKAANRQEAGDQSRAEQQRTEEQPPDAKCCLAALHTVHPQVGTGAQRLLHSPQPLERVNTDPDEARRIARDHMRGYLRLPNYVNSLKFLGYPDEDFSAGGSDRLVDAIVAWGDEAAVAQRVREHLDGGADHVLLQPLGDLNTALRQLESLAPAMPGH